MFNSDAAIYGGQNVGNGGATIASSFGSLNLVPANGLSVLVRQQEGTLLEFARAGNKKENCMKRSAFALLLGLVVAAATPGWAQAPVAGGATLGVTVTELKAIMQGWSTKRMILGKEVYNDKREKIGKVDDIIITPEKLASFAIIGVGGFLQMGTHQVAIPFEQLKIDKTIVLPGATKEALKQMPEFRYMKQR